tara:strand:+ start:471 stop:1085 length:615 start_codon:yes stop_codon:yes gene_type:complete
MTIYFGDGTNQTAAATGGKWTEISDASYSISTDSGSGWGENNITGLGGYDVLRLEFTHIDFKRYSSRFDMRIGDSSNGWASNGYAYMHGVNYHEGFQGGSASGSKIEFRTCGNGNTTSYNPPYHQSIKMEFYNWQGTTEYTNWIGEKFGFGRTDQRYGAWLEHFAGSTYRKWDFDRIQLQHPGVHQGSNYGPQTYRLRILGATY